MNEIEMKVDDVRKVGDKLYPDLAAIYNDMWQAINNVSENAEVKKYPDLEQSLKNYTSQVARYIEVSEFRLNECGKALVLIADDFGKVDEENAQRIENPVIGLVGDEDTNSGPDGRPR